MSTVRQGVLSGIVALLNVGGKPAAVPTTEVARTKQISRTLPSMIAYMTSDEPEMVGGRFGPLVRRRLTVVIECRDTPGSGENPYDSVEPMTAWVTKALGGQRIAAGSHEIVEGNTTFDLAGADRLYCLARVEVIVNYQTRVADAEQKA